MKNLISTISMSLIMMGAVLSQEQHEPPAQRIESGLPNAGVVTFANLASAYMKSNGHKAPENWSQIWDAGRIARAAISSPDRPLIYRSIAFVDGTPHASPESTAPRILAIARQPTERHRKDRDGDAVMQRAVISITPQNQVQASLIGVDKPFWKTDLDQVALKAPDPTPKQLADTVAEMFNLGFSPDQIASALGTDDIKAVKASGALDPSLVRVLDQGAPHAEPTPAFTAPTPSMADSTEPTTQAAKQFSPSFPIAPVAVLVIIIASVIMFLLRRKSP